MAGLLSRMSTALAVLRSGQTMPTTPYTDVGWSPIVRESYPGGWQQNCELRAGGPVNSAVFACVVVISQDVGKLPAHVYRTRPNGGQDVAADHPLNDLLQKPNPYQTRQDFIQQLIAITLLQGNGYAWIERDARGKPVAMHPLATSRVTPRVTDEGDVYYDLTKPTLAGGGTTEQAVTVPASEIIHHRVITFGSPLVGVSPLMAAALSSALGTRIMQQSEQFFLNASRPGGVLSGPKKIERDTAKWLKEQWEENYSGTRAGRTAVLGDGIEWKPMSTTATDSQLIEQLRYTVEDVARVYRVPGFLLGELGKVTYRNSEQLMRTYYSGCLQAQIEALEARLGDAFGLRDPLAVEFDLDALLRTDIDVRYAAYKDGLQSGFMTINEVRKLEGLPPVDGGDVPYLQQQYWPLGAWQDAQSNAPPSAKGPAP